MKFPNPKKNQILKEFLLAGSEYQRGTVIRHVKDGYFEMAYICILLHMGCKSVMDMRKKHAEIKKEFKDFVNDDFLIAQLVGEEYLQGRIVQCLIKPCYDFLVAYYIWGLICNQKSRDGTATGRKRGSKAR